MADVSTSPDEASGREKKLGRVSTETKDADLREIYNKWAKTFNDDIEKEVKYVGHYSIAEGVKEYVSLERAKECDVIDIGAGTGLVGEVLHPMGFKSIDAFDFSHEMLNIASKLGVYSKCIEGNLKKPLEIDSDKYDLAVSAGTFTLGHVTASCVAEVMRIVKRGSLFIFTVRCDLMDDQDLRDFYGFPLEIEKMHKEGKIELVQRRDGMPYHLLPGKSFGSALTCTVFVCKKL